MNRHQRRHAGPGSRASGSAGYSNFDCPCCNARKVFLQLLRHSDELRRADAEPVIYGLAGQPECMVAEFGVLQVRVYDRGARIIVTSYEAEVMNLTPKTGLDVMQDGPWVKTLAAIQADLAKRFGRIDLDENSYLN